MTHATYCKSALCFQRYHRRAGFIGYQVSAIQGGPERPLPPGKLSSVQNMAFFKA